MHNEIEWKQCVLEIAVERDGLYSRQCVRCVTSLPLRTITEAALPAAPHSPAAVAAAGPSVAAQSSAAPVKVSLPLFRESTTGDSCIVLRILRSRPTDPVPFLAF